MDITKSYHDNSDDGPEVGIPVVEVYGSPQNIARLGSPTETMELAGSRVRYYFYPTWRSQWLELFAYFVLCVLAIWGSNAFDWTIITGELFSIGGTTFYLHLPLLTLLPGFMIGKVLIYIYDSKYIIDDHGVEAHVGLVSLSLRQPRLRYEDIRGVEPNQTIVERLLGIGSVLIGSAMTQDVEIVMEGIANPRAVQLLIGGERDRRLKSLRSTQAREESVGASVD